MFSTLPASRKTHDDGKADVFLNAITTRYREVFPSYSQDKLPDPAVLLTLPDEARYGANLFGFQRVYEGTWAVDIFFEPESTHSPLDSELLLSGTTKNQ